MSTRQTRLNNPESIRKKLTDFRGKNVNWVLTDRTVVLATLINIDDQGVDVLNMRQQKIRVPFNRLSEIYFDTKE